MKRKILLILAVVVLSFVFSGESIARENSPQLAPNGNWVGGKPQLTPNGTWVGGKPELAPNGEWLENGTE